MKFSNAVTASGFDYFSTETSIFNLNIFDAAVTLLQTATVTPGGFFGISGGVFGGFATNGPSGGKVIDNLTFGNSVPEPAPLALLGLGLLGLGLLGLGLLGLGLARKRRR